MIASKLKKYHLKARQKLYKKLFNINNWSINISGVTAILSFLKA